MSSFLASRQPVPLLIVGLALACTDTVNVGQEEAVLIEICGNGFDDDGDGLLDGHCICGDPSQGPRSLQQTCYTGPIETRRVGECRDGEQLCVLPEASEFLEWGPCEGDVTPGAETCDNGLDEDCDGAVDEGCTCTDGETRACELGAARPGTVCVAGAQECEGGVWSACRGARRPEPDACGDLIDNDCDGFADLGCDCLEPEVEICDGRDNDCDGQTDEAGCLSPGAGP